MKINISKGKLKGHTFAINSDSFLIGRSPENDIQIPDPSVSRRHAKIYRNGDKYFIKDLMSSNGIRVDGNVIGPGKEIEIQQGLRFSVGDTVLDLDSLDSEKNQINQYSIDLTSVKERNGLPPFYMDRRITNRRNLELIHEVSVSLMQSLDLKTICEKILDALFYCLKRIDSGSILMVDEYSGNIIQLMNKTRDPNSYMDKNYSQSIVRQVLDEGRALMIEDVDDYGTDFSDSIELMQIKSIICVPLICRSKTKGVIYVHSVDKPNGFRKEDLYMLVALSSTAALAIDNAINHSSKTLSQDGIETHVILKNKMETIRSLAGVISHEFNNLLMCIQGHVSMLMLDIPKKSHHYVRLQKMESYVQKGAALAGQVCGFPGEICSSLCQDINPVVSSSIADFLIPLKDIVIQKNFSKDLWPVNIDNALIENALINIYSFLTSGRESGMLLVSTENVKMDDNSQVETGLGKNKYVRISVNDKNIYLNKDDLLNCFNPGLRSAGSTEKDNGTGLINAYWIMEKHGGRLNVSSNWNIGTLFHIYLPVEEC